jgi:hypothetical protein
MELLNSADSWDQMEAILFVVSTFVPNIVANERLVVPTLLEAILKLPMVDTHKQLLKTSAQLLGNLQEWLQANPDYMGERLASHHFQAVHCKNPFSLKCAPSTGSVPSSRSPTGKWR